METVTDDAANLLARYQFDPWGRRALVDGTTVTRAGFTGHRWDATASIWLALYRVCGDEFGSWLSEAPVGILEGPNLLMYANNMPSGQVDPLGLNSGMSRLMRIAYTCRMHRERNLHNKCPAREPRGSANWTQDVFPPGGKYRNTEGSECSYDICGDLEPDRDNNYSYNYSTRKYSWTHIVMDVLPAFYCGPMTPNRTTVIR